MGCLHLVWSLIVGFVVGLLARAVVPGYHHMGFWRTVILGVAGSLLGGLLGRLVSKPREGSAFHAAGFFLSLVGAVILLLVGHYALGW